MGRHRGKDLGSTVTSEMAVAGSDRFGCLKPPQDPVGTPLLGVGGGADDATASPARRSVRNNGDDQGDLITPIGHGGVGAASEHSAHFDAEHAQAVGEAIAACPPLTIELKAEVARLLRSGRHVAPGAPGLGSPDDGDAA